MILPLFLFFSAFLIYLHNLSLSVYGGDVGDFISAITTRGIPHPPGYPLFTVLGIILNGLPFSSTPAFKVGFISVLASSLSVVIFFLLCKVLTKNKAVSLVASLTLAFFYVFWLYAEIAEIFALATFFILLLFYIAVLYYQTGKKKYVYLLAFFCGLALTQQETILLIFPSLLILVLAKSWKTIVNLKTVGLSLLLLLVGFFLPYLYVPIAASFNPSVNWLGADNFNNFIRLILRSDYGWSSRSNIDPYSLLLAMKFYFTSLFIELTPAGIFLIILGGIQMLRSKNKLIFTSLLLAIFLLGPFFIYYSFTPPTTNFVIGVLERFYLFSAALLIIFLPFGIILVTDTIVSLLKKIFVFSKKKQAYYTVCFNLLFLIIPLSLFWYNFPKTDLHNIWLGDYLGRDALNSLPKNSVLLVSGDTLLFNTLYMKYALGFRKDVDIVNLGVIDRDPLIKKIKDKLKSVDKKDSDDVLTMKSILYLAQIRPLFSYNMLQFKDKKKYGNIVWYPYGLVYEYVNKSDKSATEDVFLRKQDLIWKSMHLPTQSSNSELSSHGYTLGEIPDFYARALVNLGNYLKFQYNDGERSKIYYEMAAEISPDLTDSYSGLGYYYYNKNDCRDAVSAFKKVISLDPVNENAYLSLYTTYLVCYKDNSSARKIGTEFGRVFGTSIIDEIKNTIKNGTSNP